VEIAFKSPGSKPNGLQATNDGLWIIDQGEGSQAHLVSYSDGKVLRSFHTETDHSSGITFENGTLWIGSTQHVPAGRIDAAGVRCDAGADRSKRLPRRPRTSPRAFAAPRSEPW
jgi:hypothetical protein